MARIWGAVLAVAALLRGTGLPLYHLGLTLAGAPKHPLYIGYQMQPELWIEAKQPVA